VKTDSSSRPEKCEDSLLTPWRQQSGHSSTHISHIYKVSSAPFFSRHIWLLPGDCFPEWWKQPVLLAAGTGWRQYFAAMADRR
jgi:hypothetical protein